MRWRSSSEALVVLGFALAASMAWSSCGPTVAPTTDDGESDGDPTGYIPPQENGPSANLQPNTNARVTADFLNLRDAVGTNANILVAMPCGATVMVLAGPSTMPEEGWWNVIYNADDGTQYNGWASGKFLIAAPAFTDDACGAITPVGSDGGTVDDTDGGVVAMMPPSTIVSDIFARAQLGVGYSYWWGHGAWLTDGSNEGTCTGSCPSCDHSGSYGADCSGFVAKVWQTPAPSALGVDQHPFSTYNFYNDQIYWTQVSRDSMQPADAVTRRSGDDGHIALVDSADDPYGSIWLYEARGCATGIVHNLRTVDSSYRTIRLNGL